MSADEPVTGAWADKQNAINERPVEPRQGLERAGSSDSSWRGVKADRVTDKLLTRAKAQPLDGKPQSRRLTRRGAWEWGLAVPCHLPCLPALAPFPWPEHS